MTETERRNKHVEVLRLFFEDGGSIPPSSMESDLDQRFIEAKSRWDSVEDRVYHENPEARIGDEIQGTALFGYLAHKGLKIDYKDACPGVSALSFFPDSLVRFVPSNISGSPKFDCFNLWVWSPFLKDRGFYTSSKKTYDGSESRYDCVFCPCLAPAYNEVRGLAPDNAIQIFRKIKEVYPNSAMVVDAEKASLMPFDEPGVVASGNIYTTFRMIETCSIFVGCDTGTSHYAGAIKHPRMVLLYPDESEVQERISWQHGVMAWIFRRPELVKYKASSLPCCDPRHYSTLLVVNNAVDASEVAESVHSKA